MSEFGQKLIATVREVASEKPDFVYGDGQCRYVVDGQPSCLIGQALWRLDLIDASIESRDANHDGIDTLLERLVLDEDLDEAEVEWLEAAQTRQDNRAPWGVAVGDADRRAS
ncbi:hypothetical protein JRC04_05470 [Mycolicibacterium sp. S2-37]|uniref:hypothetical protein n=1 Tax=Mycolicibacterium sp. S2-37 TaxID=2810297 RepID=UPI001A94BDC7|nr:hypothetical protein [Mycolicibacterium sp. S2-37]MBO0676905.1 hypothetical protein [Mycolicibacterium sp. S2-37]